MQNIVIITVLMSLSMKCIIVSIEDQFRLIFLLSMSCIFLPLCMPGNFYWMPDILNLTFLVCGICVPKHLLVLSISMKEISGKPTLYGSFFLYLLYYFLSYHYILYLCYMSNNSFVFVHLLLYYLSVLYSSRPWSPWKEGALCSLFIPIT